MNEIEELFVKWLCSERDEHYNASSFDSCDAKQTGFYVAYLAQQVQDFAKKINIIAVMDELRER